ncbi:ricin-type beta-trefoil lectin domain protein [Streptomyces sp. HD]|uniref:ricin-type beta-trefoil lectin domain protein n=1 Tax=Streptomyces sp. HD TaxID=3020892 RepID=UPI00232CADBB|nr:ricin-type beta-trefoil lectin domain protein [Streptomyces sp. HD]MDC0770565.1 ricin-type beta-trefoil lectin domain protein [Streptomyces sp. HD]
MQSPHPPRPPYPPRPGLSPGRSDRDLLASLRKGGADGHAVALLMARHWRATYDYAAICLVSTASSASMVTAAAFHRVLGRPGDGALRPQLLTAVRDLVKEWAADSGISALMPELGKPTGARGLRAARSATPERRHIAERAFRALPGASQCLLWHTEVEAEPITIPAGLLGVDTGTVSAAMEEVREQFRAGCVRAHRELAPTRECRYYNRLLDVPIRRGGALLPDVQQHLMACRYCRHAAEQLSHFEGGLEVLLAETVLGWGARRYLDSRPGRGGSGAVSPDPGRRGGRHRPVRLAPPRGRAKAVAVGVGLTSLALLVTVLTAKGWSEESGVPDAQATWGVPSGQSVRPSAVDKPSSGGSPSAASAEDPVAIAQGTLRNIDRGLCLDLRDGEIRSGAPAELAQCSASASQQWSYQDSGLLRSAAEPTLCLDSDRDKGTVVLADCLAHAGEVRYDLTVHGELLPRRSGGLAVAGGEDESVTLADRDGSDAQRWVLGGGLAGAPKPEQQKKKGKEEGGPDAEGESSTPAVPGSGRESPDAAAPERAEGESPEDESDQPSEQPEPEYETRYVHDDSGGYSGDETEPAAPADAVGAVVTLPAHEPATASEVARTTAATTLESAVRQSTSQEVK